MQRARQPLISRRAFQLAAAALLGGCAGTQGHGQASELSRPASADYQACEHRVPEEVCVKCHPELVPRFKAAKDWCGEHDVPESQCFKCHPDLTFEPTPRLPAGADMVEIVKAGEDLPALEPHLARGKVTVVDFYAVWCPPCKKVDAHLFPCLGTGKPLAVRKVNVVDWDSAVAERWLRGMEELPVLMVFAPDGRKVATIAGADLPALDRAIAEAGR